MSESLAVKNPNDVLDDEKSPLEKLQQELGLSDETVSLIQKIFPAEVDKENSALFLILSVYYEQAQVYYKDDSDKATALVSVAIKNYAKKPIGGYTLDDFQGFLVEEFFRIEEDGELLEKETQAIVDQTKLEIEVSLGDMKKLDDAILAFQKYIDADTGKFQPLIEKIRDRYMSDNLTQNLGIFDILTAYFDAEGKEKLFSLIDTYTTTETLLEYLLDDYFTDEKALSEKPSRVSDISSKIAWIHLQLLDKKILHAQDLISRNYVLKKEDSDAIIEYHFSQRLDAVLFLQYKNAQQFPDPLLVNDYKIKKQQTPDFPSSDNEIIDRYDTMPANIMKDLNIKDDTLAKIVKQFHYKTFVSLLERYSLDIPHHKLKGNSTREEISFMLRTLFKSSLFGDKKVTKLLQSSDDVAALLSYCLVHGDIPKDISLVLESLKSDGSLWEKEKEDYEIQMNIGIQKRGNTDLSDLQSEKAEFLNVEVDKLVDAIKHPKGTDKTDKVVAYKSRVEKNCSVNTRFTLSKLLSALGKEGEFVRNVADVDDAYAAGKVPIWQNNKAINLFNSFQKDKIGTTITAKNKQELFSMLAESLPRLAVQYNENIFELYFHTGFEVGPDGKAKSKGHRAVVRLNSDGNWEVLDPIDHPQHKITGFPLNVFFSRISPRLYKSVVVVNTSIHYGYLSEETRNTIAHGSQLLENPEAHALFLQKMGGDNYISYLDQYKTFSPDLNVLAENEGSIIYLDDLEKALPDLKNIPYRFLQGIINDIKDDFIRGKIIGYILHENGPDIIGLQKFIGMGEEDEKEPSGVLDTQTLEYLESMKEESYNNKPTNIDESVSFGTNSHEGMKP